MATAPQHLPTPTLSLRAMREDDLPGVAAAERDSYAFPWSEGVFRDCLRAGYICRVAEIDHRLVGYGILSVGAGEAHILNVCVRAEYRCRGLGRRLVTAMFDLGRAYGASDLFLEVRPSNATAIRLYQSLGLAQVGLRRGYYQAADGREDAIVMRLRLAP
ncbi:MAG: ribosomal protein S18-alanine N-acetyltransferase [Xanthomonadales bacterium]|jgi:ribosomal-protein-alanine N-acetyltransferase|nr:ribosomal protein S18-alanine N-acetyltransferase [Xanthomonadales bacterium]